MREKDKKSFEEKVKEKEKKPPASYSLMKVNNELFFLRSEAVMFEVRPEIISPPEPATLPTSVESCKPKLILQTTRIFMKSRALGITYDLLSDIIKTERKENDQTQTCFLRNQSPISNSILGYVCKYFGILLRCPETSLHI